MIPIGGETEAQVSSWTTDSLHVHLQKQIDALEARLQERADAQDKAITKSETQMDKRLDGMNELRGQLNDQAKTFITRDGYAALEGKVDVIRDVVTSLVAEKRGAGDQTKSIYALAGFVSVLLVIGTVLAANGVFG